jgi:Asp-tRNA(Asn)/Glu-tRNA(Gln) amidotransferase A subunit family amidase
VVAPKIGQATLEVGGAPEDVRLSSTRFVRAINVIGVPALSVPLTTDSPLPIGLQIIGKPFAEAAVLALATGLGH